MVRTVASDHHGRVVKDTGDGVFAVFDDGAAALAAAIGIQRALAERRAATGSAPEVRIELHTGSAVMMEDDYFGRDVVIAARIGALAGAGEILVSADLVDRAPDGAATLQRGPANLKGIPDPVDVAEIRWR
jgi:class 3 adenylate cyclase